MLNVYPMNSNSPHFGANLKSPQLKLSKSDFYIRVRGYGRNENWAKCVKETTDESVELIRKQVSLDEVLSFIAGGVKKANDNCLEINKRLHTGILRTERKGWHIPQEAWRGATLGTSYGKRGHFKYNTFELRLDEITSKPLDNPFDNIDLTKPIKDGNDKFLKHGDSKCVNNALNLIEEMYNNFLKKFVAKDIHKDDIDGVNNLIAQMRWVLAHSTPWERGSDAISNVFMKALYKAVGVKTSRPAKGVSFDMEAYCNNYNEYQKKFPLFFEKMPEVVE